MKILKYILLFLPFFVLLNCEQIDVIESDIPFQEFNVVSGRLIGDSSSVKISFTKSFPIELNLTREDVALKEVTAYIWSETQGIFTLKHEKDGIYSPVNNLYVIQGIKYELFAEFEGKRIYSVTTIPKEPIIAEAKLEGEYLKCVVVPNPRSVYAAKYSIKSLDSNYESYVDSIFYEVTSKLADTLNTIEVRTSNIPIVYFENPEKYKVEIILYSFDEPYKDYFSTRENNKPIENIFSEGGGSVFWNVSGKNTIGLFMGYTKTVIPIQIN
ncbi:MAG: hypothetical protein COW71_06400 [Ignavibacteriales bacterium CG18_big_fil_WC_8_21_14_2_50_31_20]|nr:MAG: hypothetical protein COW71_06400 [Ignavibacteriales bacterium CG18_big_fil_WC_8_21_14_2_50_31_20]